MADTPAELTPGMTNEMAFSAIAQDCANAIDLHLAVFMESASPDGPHKARVALRRLTTALDAFHDIVKRSRAEALRHEAKRIFRQLGEVRDADVYLAAQGAKSKRRKLEGTVDDLRETVRKTLRKTGAIAFSAALTSQLAGGMLFRSGAKGHADRAAPVTVLAARALDDAWSRCLALGNDVARMTEDHCHEFRKDMKSLRYLSEFFAPLWIASEFDAQNAPLQALQDELGLLNDFANARRREGRRKVMSKAEMVALNKANALWAEVRSGQLWWHGQPLPDLDQS